MTGQPIDAAAVLLADAWAPALELAQRLGHERGYVAGYRQGEDDMAASWAAIAGPIRDTLARPALDELAERRAPNHARCSSRCGRCAACIHAEAWERQGCRQYLGEELEALLARALPA